MPRLLDDRVVGGSLADVLTRLYDGSLPGYTVQVGVDGKSLVLGPPVAGPAGDPGLPGVTGPTGALVGSPGATGSTGPAGPPASQLPVLTIATNQSYTINRSDVNWDIICNSLTLNGECAILFDVPVNTSNSIERIVIRLKPGSPSNGVTYAVIKQSGSSNFVVTDREFWGCPIPGVLAAIDPCILEAVRYPNETTWFVTTLVGFSCVIPAGSGGEPQYSYQCLFGDTLILMHDDSLKHINDIMPGDLVRTHDLKVSLVKDVHMTTLGQRKSIDVNGVRMTEDHPVLTDQGWAAWNPAAAAENHITEHVSMQGVCKINYDLPANILSLNDHMMSWNNVPIKVTMHDAHAQTPVYSLILHDADTFVGGGLVHAALKVRA